jgi:hypothetical protein
MNLNERAGAPAVTRTAPAATRNDAADAPAATRKRRADVLAVRPKNRPLTCVSCER